MSALDKFINAMKLNEYENEEYDDDYADEEEEVEKAVPRKSSARAAKDPDNEEPERPVKRSAQPKVTPIRQNISRKTSGNGMEVCVIKPTSFDDDAREITETLLDNRTVVLNLEGLGEEVAQRILDFASGSCYAIGGNLQRISNFIFIITPASVEISGDFHDIFGGSFDVPLSSIKR